METLTVFGELLSLEFMQSYSRQRQHQLGPDLLEGHIYVRSLGFYPNQKDQGKPPALGSQRNHPRSEEKAGCSLKAEEISY